MSAAGLNVHLLVPSVDHSAIVVEAGPDGARLPRFELDASDDDVAVTLVSRLLRERWGISPPLLETHLPIDVIGQATGDLVDTLAVCESPPDGWQPPAGLAWEPLGTSSPMVPETIGPRLRTWLDEWRVTASPPPLRPMWSRPGWLARASAWMTVALDRAGRPIGGPIEVRRLWGISALLYAPTVDGSGAWLKAVFPRFGHEPAVTRFIDAVVPGAVPSVISIEPTEGWLLLDGVPIPDAPGSENDVVEHIRALVRIQRALAGREPELRALGCPTRPLSALADDLEWATGGTPPLAGVDLGPERLGQIVTWVRNQAERLDAVGLPDVVVHGDFHPGNVLPGPDGPLIIDWSDAAIANPIMDIGPLLGYVENTELGPRWWTVWLDALAPVGAVESLRGELAAMVGLGVAFQVASLGHILRDLEPANRYQLSDDMHVFVHSLDARVPH